VDKLIPRPVKFFLDANQGYSRAEAEELLKKIRHCRVLLIEQPVVPEDWAGLKKLHQMKLIPIIADESAVTFDDALRLLSGDYVAGVNIKMMKCGGPVNFLKIFHLAKQLNKMVMLGCMYESNISLTTAASLAMALPVDFVELDSGNQDFPDDPAVGGIKAQAGYVRLDQKLRLR
jgi:L-alanine-DL-glutamate epimerase-like enolase superfamily enzyme